MDVMTAIQTRYSCRGFADRPIEKEKIEQILEAARLAPSASNQQLCKHIVVTDKELIKKLVSACRDQQWIETAPAVLVECGAEDRDMICGQRARTVDGTIALSYMQLTAVSLGLQTCWLGWFFPEQVREILNIPEDYVVVAVSPIGYPAKEGHQAARKSLDEVAVYDQM